jgi:hypothetical protein
MTHAADSRGTICVNIGSQNGHRRTHWGFRAEGIDISRASKRKLDVPLK